MRDRPPGQPPRSPRPEAPWPQTTPGNGPKADLANGPPAAAHRGTATKAARVGAGAASGSRSGRKPADRGLPPMRKARLCAHPRRNPRPRADTSQCLPRLPRHARSRAGSRGKPGGRAPGPELRVKQAKASADKHKPPRKAHVRRRICRVKHLPLSRHLPGKASVNEPGPIWPEFSRAALQCGFALLQSSDGAHRKPRYPVALLASPRKVVMPRDHGHRKPDIPLTGIWRPRPAGPARCLGVAATRSPAPRRSPR